MVGTLISGIFIDTCRGHFMSFLKKLRWNEMKLAELRREMEDSVASRQRSSRLDNWKRLAAEAALSNNATVSIPDRIESLDLVESKFFQSIMRLHEIFQFLNGELF